MRGVRDERIHRQIEQDRGGPICTMEHCRHTEGEHRTRIFVGHMIEHDWCFTCHHVSHHERGEITREQAHHAFAPRETQRAAERA